MRNKIAGTLLCLFLIISFCLPVMAFGPSGTVLYAGIDVSQWQGQIDFAAVREDGIQVVYIRSGVGSDYTDPYFRQNYQNAKAQGLKIGFYHYVTARSVQEAQQEARFFASLVSGLEPDCKLAMDFEYFGNLSLEEINRIGLTFLETLEQSSGREAMVYSDASNARTVFDSRMAAYPLWVADYGVSQPEGNGKWESWAGFQYADNGRVGGIEGNVDLDQFTQAAFLDENSSTSPEQTTYTVKAGDTLWAIAQRFHTTVAQLVSLNQIADPNLIEPGQVLLLPSGNGEGGGPTQYTVRPGDTLWQIARRFGTTVSAIAEENGIANPALIYPGQILWINGSLQGGEGPCIDYLVKAGDTLWAIANRYGTTVEKLAGVNGIRNPALIYPGQVLRIPC